MSRDGRSFRRKTSQFWELWPLPPKVESSSTVVFVDVLTLSECCNSNQS